MTHELEGGEMLWHELRNPAGVGQGQGELGEEGKRRRRCDAANDGVWSGGVCGSRDPSGDGVGQPRPRLQRRSGFKALWRCTGFRALR